MNDIKEVKNLFYSLISMENVTKYYQDSERVIFMCSHVPNLFRFDNVTYDEHGEARIEIPEQGFKLVSVDNELSILTVSADKSEIVKIVDSFLPFFQEKIVNELIGIDQRDPSDDIHLEQT